MQLYKDIIDLYVLNIDGMIKDEDNIGAEDALNHIYKHTNIKDNTISNEIYYDDMKVVKRVKNEQKV